MILKNYFNPEFKKNYLDLHFKEKKNYKLNINKELNMIIMEILLILIGLKD